MEEQLIGFETAKLAKQKGFDWPTTYCKDEHDYQYEQHFVPRNFNTKEYEPRVSAPTQSLLQKWLREEHSLHIELTPTVIKEGYWYSCVYHLEEFYTILVDRKKDLSYEEALEAGLKKALELI